METLPVVVEIEQMIHLIRGHRVMLSTDLARLYGVAAKVLVQAVKRNIVQFPEDFMFRLTLREAKDSRSQIVTLSWGGNVKHPPFAFTEQGVAMLSKELERRVEGHDAGIHKLFEAIRGLMEGPEEPPKKIGFKP